jgi:hypothetical protein
MLRKQNREKQAHLVANTLDSRLTDCKIISRASNASILWLSFTHASVDYLLNTRRKPRARRTLQRCERSNKTLGAKSKRQSAHNATQITIRRETSRSSAFRSKNATKFYLIPVRNRVRCRRTASFCTSRPIKIKNTRSFSLKRLGGAARRKRFVPAFRSALVNTA